MRRGPWWAGGRFREDRRRLPHNYDDLPLWARLGFMAPVEAHILLGLVALICALLGAATLAVLFLPD